MKSNFKFERAADMLDDRAAGLTYREIGEKYGISKQRVCQICGKWNRHHFRVIKKDGCVFVNLRNWMNENSISRNELVRRMGMTPSSQTMARFRLYLMGTVAPPKVYIDRLIIATGMDYQTLFEVG